MEVDRETVLALICRVLCALRGRGPAYAVLQCHWMRGKNGELREPSKLESMDNVLLQVSGYSIEVDSCSRTVYIE